MDANFENPRLPISESLVPIEKVGRLIKFNPVDLTGSTTLPNVEPGKYSGPRLGESIILDKENRRCLFTGDSHGLIFPMLLQATERVFSYH